jgi:predicted nucleic acid-binding protein
MDSWGSLFERAAEVDADERAVRDALASVRAEDGDRSDADTDAAVSTPAESGPARVVADADVLAADLLVGGDAREALDHLRSHSWTTLLASDPLVADAEAVVADLADPDLAAAWRERVGAWRESVSHPTGDNPALGTAYRGGAMHLLTFDDQLRSARAGATLGTDLTVSARHPGAFAALFDASSLYPEVVGGEYPGPDRDPRG